MAHKSARMIACASITAALAAFSLANSAFAAGALTEQNVKDTIQKITPGDKFEWKSIQIAPPRRASNGEIGAAGLPPNATVNVVKAEFVQYTGQGPWKRDHVQHYYFFKDDFGNWSEQADATPGNATSEPHQ